MGEVRRKKIDVSISRHKVKTSRSQKYVKIVRGRIPLAAEGPAITWVLLNKYSAYVTIDFPVR